MSATLLYLRHKHAELLASIYAVVFIASRIVDPRAHSFGHGIVDVYQAILPILAGAWGIKLARRDLQTRQFSRIALGWLFMAVGCLMWGFGDVLSAYYGACLQVDPPFPGLSDAFYLPAYVIACIGLALLFKSLTSPRRTREILDSAAVTCGVAVASWSFVIRPIWSAALAPATKIVSIVYPVLDLVVLFIAIALMSSHATDRKFQRSKAWATFGLVLIGAADTGFAYYNVADAYHSGLWPDFCGTAGWLSVCAAFAIQLWLPVSNASPKAIGSESPSNSSSHMQRSVLRMLLPYIAATLVCMALIANDYVTNDRVSLSTFCSSYFVIALVLIRQVVTLFENQQLNRDLESRLVENRRLTSRLRSFSDGLEQVVALRAQQLGALHQLTKAVHTTQQVDGVLEAAAKHTVAAMRGLTVAIWLRESGSGPSAPPYCLSCFEVTIASPEIERFAKCYVPRSSDDAYVVEIPATSYAEPADSESCEGSILGEMLCAPLRFRNEILGIIAVSRLLCAQIATEQSIAFDHSDHDLIESIGIEVATALYHARQFAAAVDAADHDPVTNLYNHRAIHQRFDEELSLAQAENLPLSIMMMDLNDFKLFNDTYGHPVGDQVLRLVARALREENPDAICGRYGGDEFLVLGPRTTASQARDFAERLRQRLISQGFQNPMAGNGQTIPIAISFGLAMFPDDSVDRHDLLTLADANLYKAKKSESGIGVTNSSQRVNSRLKTESSFGILDAMVTSIDNKDKYTRRHSEDVTRYALWLAQELRLSDETMRVIRVGALLHDVGKIGIPEEVLRKPGQLTPEEYEVIKQHPNLGALIVGAVPGMESIIDAVRSHHERWDGRGYPDSLAGTDIPMIGRIMAVADAFSAMTTNRAYRAGMDWQTALDEVQNNIGTQFDPLMARAFCNAVRWRLSIESPKGAAANPETEDELPLAA